jgi:hypothetical protein
MGISVLLLTDLAENDTDLVRKVADGLISGVLAPLRELLSDGHALLAGGFMGGDQVVLGLDEFEELARELRLGLTAQRVEGKTWSAGCTACWTSARGLARPK